MESSKEIWKLIYVLLFIFILYGFSSLIENKEETVYDNLELSYVQDDGVSLIEYTRYKYDDSGNVTEENTYKPDGKLYVKKEWKYDANGNCIREYYNDAIGSDSEMDWKYEYKYKYNSDNQIVSRNVYINNKLNCFESYRYLNDIKASIEYYYNDTGSVSFYNKKVYDKSNRQLCYYSYDPYGTVTEFSYVRYDNKDRCIYKVTGKDEDNPDKVLMSEYDDIQHIGKEVCKEGAEITKIRLNEYTEDGDMVKGLSYKETEGGNVLEQGYWASYNDGYIIEEMEYDADKKYKLRSYVINVYDESHNITKKIKFEASAVSDNMYFRRVITYKYDEDGRLYLVYKEDINQQYINHNYENGCNIKIEFNDDKSLLSVIKYDEQGRYKEKIIFKDDGDIKCREVYSYDESNSEIYVYDIEGKLLYTK